MNIRKPKELKSFAAQRLLYSQSEKRIVAIYAALALGLSALVTVVNYVLDLQISQSGGLGNMGTRTVLSSLQNMTPIAQSLVVMCLDVGYMAAMLRIARGQYSSPQTLRLGFDRFWVLLRCTVLKGLFYFSALLVSVYAASLIYTITPLSDAAAEILMPLISDTSILDSGLMIDDATYTRLLSAMTPVFLIWGVLFCIFVIPIFYQYRMTSYVIIDRPAMGAMAALRESKKMMRGNRRHLFKLDLSMWWFYLLSAVITVVCYGDVLLPMMGVTFPWHEDVGYFMFFALYLALMFVLYYFLRNRVDVAYALAYDSVKPEEKKDNGVVLGNIFDM